MTVPTPTEDEIDTRVLAHVYDVALLDLDGVVYIGASAVHHAPEALLAAREEGMRLAFVTNNASRAPEAVAAHLTELGIEAFDGEVVTSAQAAARLLAERLRPGARVLVVGGDGLRSALDEKGLVPVSSATDAPEAVVQGFAPQVDWRALAEGSYAVAQGLPWIASNADRTIPTQRGIAPGNGALIEVIRAATGREPVVAGKPEPPMHREAMLRSGAVRPIVVGDRLDTDIEGAARAGADSLLVFTGVATAADAVLAPAQARPMYLGEDLRALHLPGASLLVRAGSTRRGAWSAAVDGGVARLQRSPGDGREPAGTASDEVDGLDAVRALCGAVWPSPQPVDPDSVYRALRDAGIE
ncbi:HAD-IIA family hydrolase [Phytoactinopolyspora alkaliphila]|uniref:HAD-IIA family hydrolase n=1 Tax=Phytoactinopolyspora alkaliphila TaxID=1783498 RepID=UPI001C209341